jgi:hypothetical protein
VFQGTSAARRRQWQGCLFEQIEQAVKETGAAVMERGREPGRILLDLNHHNSRPEGLPETFEQLVEHYRLIELDLEKESERKVLPTKQTYAVYLKARIVPRWGHLPSSGDQSSRSRAVAWLHRRSSGWDQSKNQGHHE